MYVCVYVCMYVCLCICLHICTCVCMWRARACVRVYVRACTDASCVHAFTTSCMILTSMVHAPTTRPNIRKIVEEQQEQRGSTIGKEWTSSDMAPERPSLARQQIAKARFPATELVRADAIGTRPPGIAEASIRGTFRKQEPTSSNRHPGTTA